MRCQPFGQGGLFGVGGAVAAHDLRKGKGTILSVDSPIKAPLLDDLLAAFAVEGAIDTGVARLVTRDIDRVGALQAAAEVRVHLAQAMMDTQRGVMSQTTTLFSGALNRFDQINAGGFTPSRLNL